jgi:deazaflavin-dependent oxidoreductase (nitroreductase family)
MLKETLQTPQPFPYPECWLVKKLLKTPVLLYRLGMGKLFGNYILILSTTGRKTGKTRRTPVEYFLHEGQYYIISGFGEGTDWYLNIQESPQVTIQNGFERVCAIARPPETEEEWQAVYLYLTHSPVGKLLVPAESEDLPASEIIEGVHDWPVLTFEPTDQPCPTPLEADLVWAWPLILLGMAFDVTTLWLLSRRKKAQ